MYELFKRVIGMFTRRDPPHNSERLEDSVSKRQINSVLRELDPDLYYEGTKRANGFNFSQNPPTHYPL